MDETTLSDPTALAEQLSEWQLAIAQAVDALKQVCPEETHRILDTIERCHGDARDLILGLQEAYLVERARHGEALADVLASIRELRAEIQSRTSRKEHDQ